MGRVARLVLLSSLLVVALVSFVVIRSQQGNGGGFVARQNQAEALTPTSVDRAVRVAPQPGTRTRGRWARCRPLGSGLLHNPWRCRINYPSGQMIQYRVTIRAGGGYTGDDQLVSYRGRSFRSPGEITGCCVVIP